MKKEILKKQIRSLLFMTFLVSPILSMLVAMCVYIFGNLILNQGISEILVFRYSYFAFLIVQLITGIYEFLSTCKACKDFAKQYETSPEEVYKAMSEFELKKEEDWRKWTPEEFQRWLMIREASQNMAQDIMKNFGA